MREIILKPKKQDQKQFHMEIKAQDSGKRQIKGFASTRFVDRMDEIVSPGALAGSMDIYMKSPVVLRDHDRSLVIGKTIDYQVVADGLFVTIEIMKGTEDADEAWAQIEFGALNAFSIGFIPKNIDLSGEYPVINDLELLEISVVSIPANRESLFSIAKAFELGTDMRDATPKKIGFDKTKAEMSAILRVIESNWIGLQTENKLYIETFLNSLHTIVKADQVRDEVSDSIERMKLELEIEEQKARLNG